MRAPLKYIKNMAYRFVTNDKGELIGIHTYKYGRNGIIIQLKQMEPDAVEHVQQMFGKEMVMRKLVESGDFQTAALLANDTEDGNG